MTKKYYNQWRKKNREYINLKLVEWRHKKGISKKYSFKYGGTKTNKIYFRKMYLANGKKSLWNRTRCALRNGAGVLLRNTIQMVYEDNIKQYGTLTCYLCLKPIPFGNDHLEHKTPLSRGGSNQYENLAIACQKCNCSKYNKTIEEFNKQNNCSVL